MPRLAAFAAILLAALASLAATGAATASPARASTTVDDPLFPDQWGLTATGAPAVWALPAASARVVVAVVDSGVDAGHPDLAGKVLPGWNVIAGSSDTRDDNGHGTAIAGIIAATTGNGTGIASYCWRCVILPVKVLDSNALSTPGAVAAGIVWAADHGARVINVSIGTLTDDAGLQAAVAHAVAAGALVVAAAGNDGPKLPTYPAAEPGALAVAASDQSGNLFRWSNSGSWIQLAAPGDNLTTSSNGGYADFLGTSSAAPVVAGIAALAFAVAPRATPAQVAAALERSAKPMPGVHYGFVDAAAAVRTLLADPTLRHAPAGRPKSRRGSRRARAM